MIINVYGKHINIVQLVSESMVIEHVHEFIS